MYVSISLLSLRRRNKIGLHSDLVEPLRIVGRMSNGETRPVLPTSRLVATQQQMSIKTDLIYYRKELRVCACGCGEEEELYRKVVGEEEEGRGAGRSGGVFAALVRC